MTVFLKPMSRHALLRVRVDAARCVGCGRCRQVCPMDVDVPDGSPRRANATECILCLRCTENCPRQALHL